MPELLRSPNGWRTTGMLIEERAGAYGLCRTVLSGDKSPLTLSFESRGPDREESRYSYEARDPWLLFRSSGATVNLEENGVSSVQNGNPFDFLEDRIVSSGRAPSDPGLPPLPEYAGYIGYGASPWTIPVKHIRSDPFGLPDMAIGFFDVILVRDRMKDRTWIISTGLPEVGSAREDRAYARLRSMEERIVPIKSRPSGDDQDHVRKAEWLPPMPPDYEEAVGRALEYIRDGQIYQANLTRLFRADTECDPWTLYENLADRNLASYSGILQFRDFSLISSSPELLLRQRGDHVMSKPIKGTAARSNDTVLDRANASALLRSAKDRAEHVMIVDLVRNDIGKGAEFGSVSVDPFTVVESCPSVHHLVSTVHGRLREGMTSWRLLQDMLPGGSITGAPKIRAVEIIDKLELDGRGAFYGTMGFGSFDRQAVWNLLIRSAVVKNGEVGFRVGGGIVADSDPQMEWRELALKGSLLHESLRRRGVGSCDRTHV